MRRTFALLLLSLLSITLLSGCLQVVRSTRVSVGSAPDGSAETSKAGTPGARGVPESTVGASRIEGDFTRNADASSGLTFVGRTEESGGSGYDADTVLAVRYGVREGYERTVIDLGTGEEPAGTVPKWTLLSPKDGGLLRVNLPSASATCVSGGGFGDGLLEGFHVVRAPGGGMFVDFLTRKAFRYRVLGLQNPARLVIDFEPTEEGLNVPPPAEGGHTVLVEPRPGDRISDPLTVSGYSRNPANTISLTGPHGKVLVRRTVRSEDWGHTWGYFETTIDLPPFPGRGTLRVGASGARGGSFEGVEIPVRAGGPARFG